ncbi:MAG: GNAT family N-acetyltransferase [Saprospiraceae bacterium]|nr:GNAT family N-acetyltransferase [Saprospiraceae bacterium]
MLVINFGPFPVLKTERLILREMVESDAEALLFLRTDPVVMKYLDRPKMESIEKAREFIGMVGNNFTQNEGINWAISIGDDPAMIGNICIWRIDKPHYRGEIGYAMHPAFHGQGIMQEAMRVVLNYGFNEMGLHSIEANVNPENLASIRLLERHGFRREAYFRENYYFEGTFMDSAIYSLIGREFFALG